MLTIQHLYAAGYGSVLKLSGDTLRQHYMHFVHVHYYNSVDNWIFLNIFKPVFPEVGSMTVSPGFNIPSFSASSIILTPIRSFTDPPALKYSHLPTGWIGNTKLSILHNELEIQLYTTHDI